MPVRPACHRCAQLRRPVPPLQRSSVDANPRIQHRRHLGTTHRPTATPPMRLGALAALLLALASCEAGQIRFGVPEDGWDAGGRLGRPPGQQWRRRLASPPASNARCSRQSTARRPFLLYIAAAREQSGIDDPSLAGPTLQAPGRRRSLLAPAQSAAAQCAAQLKTATAQGRTCAANLKAAKVRVRQGGAGMGAAADTLFMWGVRCSR